MSRSLFGTDGVRGRANSAPMTAEIAMRIGMAAGQVFNRGGHRHRVVIGKDTRLSGYMFEAALEAGFAVQGRAGYVRALQDYMRGSVAEYVAYFADSVQAGLALTSTLHRNGGMAN